jgi:hypothetical protein
MRRATQLILISAAAIAFAVTGCANQEEPATTSVANPTVPPAETLTPTAAPATATPLAEPDYQLARVESLEVLASDEEPAAVGVRLRGMMSTSCSRIDDIVTELKGDVFTIAVLEVLDPPEPNEECTTEGMPFDRTTDLVDVVPGSYTVSVHGLQGSFTIEALAAPLPESATVTPAPASGSISGIVWHDLCDGSGSTLEDPPAGCVLSTSGQLQADGILDAEQGIEGVRVGIAAGECDAPATDFSPSGADGKYVFNDLPAGQYCVSIDETGQQNQDVLLTGVWTSPSGGVAEQLVIVEESAEKQDIDFGWDFEFLPIAEFSSETCNNSFAYLEDVNIPDDTEFAPDEPFTKRWLLQNNGTCPWTDDYTLVFVGGEQMSAPDIISLVRPVAPGQTLEVAIDMIAPAEPGTYRGNWQISDPNGEPFGIDGIIEDAFWLRIVVTEDAVPAATPTAGLGAIGGVVWDDLCFNSDPGSDCLEFPENSGLFIADGAYGPLETGLAEITISLATQSCPAAGSLPPADRILRTVQTTDDGQYLFQDLETGMYCIFMDALSDENVNFLIPGNWTWPATGVGRYTFFLDPGEQALDLDFGWDFVD